MKVIEMLGVEPAAGEVGIEIEVEGRHLAAINSRRWRTENDGSLRGESAEFVLKAPVKRENVAASLKELSDFLEAHKCHVADSPRTGTHIHVNVQQMNYEELMAFIATYLCFEETLVKWCGEERYGNLFCLTASQAEGNLSALVKSARMGSLNPLYSDRHRYGAMNPKAIGQYGSLEFRSLRGTVDMPVIEKWVSMLLTMKDYAIGKTPSEVVSMYSIMGPQDFFNSILGAFRDDLEPTTRDLVTGLRNAQELAFCREWEHEGHPDPRRKFEVEVDVLYDEEDDEEDFG